MADDLFITFLRQYLNEQLPDWHEVVLNEDDLPTEFPAWEVDYDGGRRQGNRFRTQALISVVIEFSTAPNISPGFEKAAKQIETALLKSPDILLNAISPPLETNFKGAAQYAGFEVSVEEV